MSATWGTACANIPVAANARKEPRDSALPTVEVVAVNSKVATREHETRTFAPPMVVESDVNLTDVASQPWVVPISVPPTEGVVDVRWLVASSLLSRPPSFVSSMVVERNAFLRVVKRLPVAVPNSVRLMVVVSGASWKVVLVWRLESPNYAEPMVVAITHEAKRMTVPTAHLRQWEDPWAGVCPLRDCSEWIHSYCISKRRRRRPIRIQ